MNDSELLQLAKGWGNFVSNRTNIWRLPKPNQIELKIESGKEGENGYRKRAGRVLVLLALCIIFRIFPESTTRTDESRVDEFEADWLVELDRVGTTLIRTRRVLFCS